MTYRWQELGLTFELRSNDVETLRAARRILSPGAPEVDGDHDRYWTMDRNEADHSFRLTGGSIDRSLLPVEVPTRHRGLLHIEYDLVEYITHRSTLPAVHGALLSRDGNGVLIVGPSLAGKSTLAVGLWRAGWSLLSDDVALIDAERGIAYPAPRRVSLRFGSREVVGENLWQRIADLPSCAETQKGLFFHPHELDGSPRVRETRISAIVFLARRGVELPPALVQRINPAAACVALVPYAFKVRDLAFPEAVATLSPLTATVPAVDLARGDLPMMIRAVELQLGG